MKELRGGRQELARGEDNALYSCALASDQRALAAIIINMLHRHTHAQRQAILRFALAQEQYIPVNTSSVFSGTSIMPGEAPELK